MAGREQELCSLIDTGLEGTAREQRVSRTAGSRV